MCFKPAIIINHIWKSYQITDLKLTTKISEAELSAFSVRQILLFEATFFFLSNRRNVKVNVLSDDRSVHPSVSTSLPARWVHFTEVWNLQLSASLRMHDSVCKEQLSNCFGNSCPDSVQLCSLFQPHFWPEAVVQCVSDSCVCARVCVIFVSSSCPLTDNSNCPDEDWWIHQMHLPLVTNGFSAVLRENYAFQCKSECEGMWVSHRATLLKTNQNVLCVNLLTSQICTFGRPSGFSFISLSGLVLKGQFHQCCCCFFIQTNIFPKPQILQTSQLLRTNSLIVCTRSRCRSELQLKVVSDSTVVSDDLSHHFV